VEYHSVELDAVDVEIINVLQNDSKISNAELARRVNLSPPAIHARIRRLEETGVIYGYAALINREAVGYDMLCFIQVSLQTHIPEMVQAFRAQVANMPEVLECHQLIGDIDYLLKVVIVNKGDLQRFLMERITPIPGVARVKTSLALTEIKSTTVLPIPNGHHRENHHAD
jgi:Lrp/AsnC family transcriptional regulator, leucine-responsive regulatory protein